MRDHREQDLPEQAQRNKDNKLQSQKWGIRERHLHKCT
ncbi:hypothetical protein SynPROS91_00246 [Synechococcus sp. PROS-9-1]|nr:hypothetical protein SynPROS91_00246 [Synechococcus sp. PROS-9-1]